MIDVITYVAAVGVSCCILAGTVALEKARAATRGRPAPPYTRDTGHFCAQRGGNPGDRLIEGLLEELVAPTECEETTRPERERMYREAHCATCGQSITRKES